MINGFKVAVAVFGVMVGVAGSAEAGVLGTCAVDASLQPVCVNADVACIVGLSVHLCLPSCTTNVLGGLANCAAGVQSCLLGTQVLQCPAIPATPALPTCTVDVNGDLGCLSASAQCLLNGTVRLCTPTGTDIGQCTIGVHAEILCADANTSSCLIDGAVQTCSAPPEPTDPTDPGDPPDPSDPPNPGPVPNPGVDPTPTPDDGTGAGAGSDDPEGGAETYDAYGGGCSTSGSSSSLMFGLGIVGMAIARKRRNRRAQALIVAGIAAAPAIAAADVNADLMRSNNVAEGGVMVGNTDVLAYKQVQISGLTSYASSPLELRGSEGDRMSLIDSQTSLDLRGSVGLGKGFEATMLVPVILGRTGDASITGGAMGDIGVGAKWSTRQGRYGFAVSPELVMPTGSEFASDGSWGGSAVAAGDARFGRTTVAANIGGSFRAQQASYEGAKYEQQIMFGGLVDYNVAPEYRVHLVGEVYANAAIGDSTRGSPAEAMGHVRWSTGDWTILAGGGAGLSNSVGVPDWRAFVGGAYTLGSRPPRKALPAPYVAAAEPAPPPAAPSIEAAPPAPMVVEVKIVDRDGDGINDDADKCPDIAETKNGFEDDDGCADNAPTYLFSEASPLVFHDIHFESNKWRILPDSFSTLDDIAASLQSQPKVRIRIEGHTDGRGGEQQNLMLSQQRALATLNYLVAAGIDPQRLEYQGYGLSRPVADNKTDAGRKDNRRVEIRTLSH